MDCNYIKLVNSIFKMSLSTSRLSLISGHVVPQQTAAKKDKISTVMIGDNQKQYPEFIDYHPEKGVMISFISYIYENRSS